MPPSAPHTPLTSVQAERLLGVLAFLEEDVRVKAILGDAPLRALEVSARRGALTIAPSAALDPGARKVIQEAIEEAFAQVGDEGRHAARGAEEGDKPAIGAADPRPHLIAARAHLDSGNPGRAMEVLDAALPRWPDNPDLHAYRALALTALGHSEEAVAEYREVIRCDPQSAFAHAGAAQLLAKLGRWNDALAHASSGLVLHPQDPALLHVQALADEHLGLYDDALHALERALELDPYLPNGDEDLRRIKLLQQQDVQVSFLGAEADEEAEDLGDVDVSFITAEPAAAAGAAEPQPPTLPPETGPRADVRWGVAAHRAEDRAGWRCEDCGAANPAGVIFCVKCGNKPENGE